MAGNSRELLITLGADTTSFEKQIRRARDITKSLDSQFDLLASSSKDYEKSLDGLAKKQDILNNKIKIHQDLSKSYIKSIQETKEQLNSANKRYEEASKKVDNLKKSQEGLQESSSAYKKIEEALVGANQELTKASAEVNKYSNKVLRLSKDYNVVQKSIQGWKAEVEQTTERLKIMDDVANFDRMKGDIKELDRNFELLSTSTKNFGNTMESLDDTQTHLNNVLAKSKELSEDYSTAMQVSALTVSEYKGKVSELETELRKYEKIMNSYDEEDVRFGEYAQLVEQYRIELTSATAVVEMHEKQIEDLGKEYKNLDKSIATYENRLNATTQKMKTMMDGITFEKVDTELEKLANNTIARLQNELNDLNYEFKLLENSTDNFGKTTDSLEEKQTHLKNALQLNSLTLEEYNKIVKDSQDKLLELTERKKQLETEMKKKVDLKDSLGAKELDELNESLKKSKEEYADVVKEIDNWTKTLKSSEQSARNNTLAISNINKELRALGVSIKEIELKEVFDSLDKVFDGIDKEIKSLENSFDILSTTTKNFGSTAKSLGETQEHYNSLIDKSKSLLKKYSDAIELSTKAIEENKQEIDDLEKEIKKYQSIMNSSDFGSDAYKDASEKVQELTTRLNTTNKSLELHGKQLSDLEGKYTSVTKRVATFENKLETATDKLKNLIDGITFDKVESDIEKLSNNTVNRLSRELDDLNREFKLLQTSTDNFGKTTETLEQQQSYLNNALKLNKLTLEEYNKTVNDSKQRLMELTDRKKELERELEKKVELKNSLPLEEIDKLNESFKEAKEEYEQVTSELNRLNSELNTTEQNARNVTQTISSINKELRETSATMAEVRISEVFETLDNVTNSLNDEIKTLENSFDLLNLTTKNFGNTFESLSQTQSYYNSLIDKSSVIVNGFKNSLNLSNKAIENAKIEISQLEREIAKYRKEMELAEVGSETFINASNKVDKLQVSLARSNKVLELHSNRVADIDNKYKATVKQIATFENKLETARDKAEALRNSLVFDTVETEFERLANDSLNNLNKRLDDTKFKFDLVKNSTEDFAKSTDNLESQQQYLTKALGLTNNILVEHSKRAEVASNKLNELVATKKKLETEMEKQLSNVDILDTKGLDKLNETLKETREEYDRVVNEINKFSSELNKSEQGVKSAKNSLVNLANELKATRVAVENLRIDEEFSKFDSSINKTEKEIKELQHSFDIISATTEDFGNTIESLTMENEHYSDILSKNVTMNKNFANSIKQTKNSITEYKLRVDELNNEIEYYNSLLRNQDPNSNAFNKYSRELEMLQAELSATVVGLERYENRLESLDNQYKSNQKSIANLENKIESSSKKMEQIIDSISFDKVETEIEKLANDSMARLNNEIDDLRYEFDLLKSSTDDFTKTTKGLETQQDYLTSSLKLTKKSLEQYNNSVEETQRKLLDLTTRKKQLDDALQTKVSMKNLVEGSDLDDLIKEIDELKQEYEEVVKDIDKFDKKLKDSAKGAKDAKTSIANMTKELKSTSSEIDDLNKKRVFDGLENSITEVNNKLKLLDAEINLSNAIFKNYENSLLTLSQRKKSLADQIDLNKNKLSVYNNSIKAHSDVLSVLDNEYQKLQTEIRETNQELENTNPRSEKYQELAQKLILLQAEFDDVNDSIREHKRELSELQAEQMETQASVINLTRELNTSLGNSLKDIGSKVQNFGNEMMSIGQSMMPMTVALGGIGTMAVKTGMEFSSAMAEVQAVTGATGKEFEDLTNKARLMGAQTTFTAEQSAQGLKYLGLAGYSASEAMDALPQILQLAQAGAMELSTASDLATDSLSSLGYTTEESVAKMPEYLNKVAQASRNANTSIEQLMEAYITGGGQISELNIELDTSATMLGILADQGIKGSQAGNALNSVLINFIKTTGESAKALDQLGVSMFTASGEIRNVEDFIVDLAKALSTCTEEQRAQYLAMIGGKTQYKTLSKLLNGMVDETGNLSERYKELKGEIAEGFDTKALEEMSEIMTDNLAGDFEKLKSAISESFLSIFDTIEPSLRDMTQKLTKFVTDLTNKFVALDADTQKFILGFGVFLTVLPPITLAVGLLTKSFGMLFSGIGNVLSVFGNLKTAFDLFTKTQGGFTNKIQGVINGFTGLQKVFNGFVKVGNLLSKSWGLIVTGAKALALAIGGISAPVWGAIAVVTALVGAGYLLIKNWESVKKWATDLGNSISEGFNKIKDGVSDALTKMGESAKNAFESLKQGVVDGWNNAVNSVKDGFKNMLSALGIDGAKLKSDITNLWNTIKDGTSEIWESISLAVSKVWNDIATAITDWFNTVKSTVSDSWNQIKQIYSDSVGKIWDEIKNTFSNIGKTIGDTFNSVYDTIKNVVNNIKETVSTMFSEGMSKLLNEDWEGFKETVRSGMESIKTFISDGWNNITTTFSDAMSNIGKFFSDGWNNIVGFATQGVEGIKSAIDNTIQQLSYKMGEIFGGLGANIITTLSDLGTSIGQKWDEMLTRAGEFGQGIKDNLTNAYETTKTNVINKLEEWRTNSETKFQEMVNNATTKSQEITTNVTNKIEEMKTNAKQKIEEMKTDISTKFSEMKTTMESKIRDAYTIVKTVVGGLVGDFIQNITNLRGNITNKFNEIKDTISNAINTAKNNVVNYVSNMISNVMGSITSLPSKISSALGGLADIITSPFKNAWNTISGIFGNISRGVGNAISSISGKKKSIDIDINGSTNMPITTPYLTYPTSDFDISNYKTSGDWYSPNTTNSALKKIGAGAVSTATQASNTISNIYARQLESEQNTQALIETMISLLITQNELIRNNGNQSINIDGREVARAVAPYSRELDRYQTRNPRFSY